MRNPTFSAILDEMERTHDRKNEDYAEDGNPYSNFEGAAAIAGVDPNTVFHALIGIKSERLRQLMTGKTPNNESLEDSILDLAVYATLWLAWRRDLQAAPYESLQPYGDEESVELGPTWGELQEWTQCGDPECPCAHGSTTPSPLLEPVQLLLFEPAEYNFPFSGEPLASDSYLKAVVGQLADHFWGVSMMPADPWSPDDFKVGGTDA